MRSYNRGLLETRPVTLTPNINKHAEGSCLVEFGDTKVQCTASVEEKVPEQGVLLVRPTSVAQTKLWMPLPDGLALRPTDLVLTTVTRGTLATRTYALITGGDPQGPVDLQPVVLRTEAG